MGYEDDKGEIIGYDIDLAKDLGAGVVKLQPIVWLKCN